LNGERELFENSENLDLGRFFKELLRKNIKSTYLNEGKSPIKLTLLTFMPNHIIQLNESPKI
jgi:hypothetical protein